MSLPREHPVDPRVLRGTRAMLALRDQDISRGDRPLGWKAAFGSPSGMAALGLDHPLVGYLTESRRIDPGTSILLEGWTRPVLEAEVAVHLADDLPAGATRTEIRAAIGGLSAAIEVADVDPPPTDVEVILGGNIFHRHVILGDLRAGRDDLDGLAARVMRDDVEVAHAHDPEALTGRLHDVLAALAVRLAAVGEQLRAGDVVITGSMVPPLDVAAGERLLVDVVGLGQVDVSFV